MENLCCSENEVWDEVSRQRVPAPRQQGQQRETQSSSIQEEGPAKGKEGCTAAGKSIIQFDGLYKFENTLRKFSITEQQAD